TGMSLLFYGCFRFFVEFFRMPDAQLGFLALDWVTMGQILSTPMMIIGAGFIYFSYKKSISSK
ncbi:MAG: prolipoprotein diacylglyceryl transferase family protein, partial [bacterium]